MLGWSYAKLMNLVHCRKQYDTFAVEIKPKYVPLIRPLVGVTLGSLAQYVGCGPMFVILYCLLLYLAGTSHYYSTQLQLFPILVACNLLVATS